MQLSSMEQAFSCFRAGNLLQAEALCSNILQNNADDHAALFLLGAIASQNQQIARAIELFERAVHQSPDQPIYRYNLGNAFQLCGRVSEAIPHYLKALSQAPQFVEALFNCAQAYRQIGHRDEAVAALLKVVSLTPEHADAHAVLGTLFLQRGENEKAVNHYSRAVQISGDNAELLCNLGVALRRLNRNEEGISCFESALGCDANFAPAHYNLANALQDGGEDFFAQAVFHYSETLRLSPGYAEAHNNLGRLLQRQGKLAEALHHFESALTQKSDFEDARWNYALALLLTGDLKQGFPAYESRLTKTSPTDIRAFSQPRWDGKTVPGKKLLITVEQGVGDILQFSRFLAAVREKCGRLLLECPGTLQRLLVSSDLADELLLAPISALDKKFDYHFPLLSLPALLETTLATIPNKVPYLHPPPDLIAQKSTLFNREFFNVGVVWAGNPEHADDRSRSCPLKYWEILEGVDGVRFYALQKRESAGLSTKSTLFYGDLGQELNDFADTAALIMNLDLLITVDTASAHLAGALGRPVWTILPLAPDWRWLLDREDSPWYPSMRLFRQIAPGEWDELFNRLRAVLKDVVLRSSRERLFCYDNGFCPIKPQ